MSEPSDDRVSEKRRRIVEAARFLMLRHGLRGTTMEAIAREAQIAKPTLYAHFPDKDAIFASIVATLMDEILLAYDSGMNGPGDISERVGNALAGQYLALSRALAGSPHATELMSEHKRAGIKLRETDLRAEAEIAAELHKAGGSDAETVARILCAAAYGIALKTPDEAEMTAGIKLVSRRMVNGALGSFL